MECPPVVWKRDTAQYTCGYLAYIGKIRVGSSYYDSCQSKGDPLKYAAGCLLPGLKKLGHYETEEEAQAAVERMVKVWFSACMVEQTPVE